MAARDALAELDAARSGVRHYGPHGETTPEDLADSPVIEVFVDCHAAPPQMWIFGAVDFTAALAKVAKLLGYRVTVCDAREVFATRRRFPMADEVLVTWPAPLFAERGQSLGARDAVCILTHDAKFDVPAVVGALGDERRLHRGDGQPDDAQQAAGPPRRGRRQRPGPARPADVAGRSRHRCPHPRGDGDQHLRRDHRHPHRTISARQPPGRLPARSTDSGARLVARATSMCSTRISSPSGTRATDFRTTSRASAGATSVGSP